MSSDVYNETRYIAGIHFFNSDNRQQCLTDNL